MVKPQGPLELVPGVQQQHVLLRVSNFSDFRRPPRDSAEAVPVRRIFLAARGPVHVELFEPSVDVVGMENSQIVGEASDGGICDNG